MSVPKIFESEYRFCLILWEREPIKSSELVSLCSEQLGWKPTTTYTVIKRLSERGILENNNKISCISQDVLFLCIASGILYYEFHYICMNHITVLVKQWRIACVWIYQQCQVLCHLFIVCVIQCSCQLATGVRYVGTTIYNQCWYCRRHMHPILLDLFNDIITFIVCMLWNMHVPAYSVCGTIFSKYTFTDL